MEINRRRFLKFSGAVNTAANARDLNAHVIATVEVNPHHVLFMEQAVLSRYGKRLRPVAQATASRKEWLWLLQVARGFGMSAPSFWRYRCAGAGIWQALAEEAGLQEQEPITSTQAAQLPAGPTPTGAPGATQDQPSQAGAPAAGEEAAGSPTPEIDLDARRNPYNAGPRFKTQYRITGKVLGNTGE